MPAKTYREFAASIIDTLESLGITYAIGGSFASNAYGEARLTLDIDISVVLPQPDVKRFVDALQAQGYYITYDSIVDALVHDLPFNIIDATSGYKADLFLFKSAPLEQSILARRQRVEYDPESRASAMLYSPEDVIIYKLKYYLLGQSQKHLRDIGAILIVQAEALDRDYIAYWAGQIGASDIWQQLLEEYHKRSSAQQH
jgi:hypothetical protein